MTHQEIYSHFHKDSNVLIKSCDDGEWRCLSCEGVKAFDHDDLVDAIDLIRVASRDCESSNVEDIVQHIKGVLPELVERDGFQMSMVAGMGIWD
jgi:hypothetical protein